MSLFDLPREEDVLPKRIRDMHSMYGAEPGRTCGECLHLLMFRRASTWFKCDLTRMTASAATDWRKSWPACGKFKPREE